MSRRLSVPIHFFPLLSLSLPPCVPCFSAPVSPEHRVSRVSLSLSLRSIVCPVFLCPCLSHRVSRVSLPLSLPPCGTTTYQSYHHHHHHSPNTPTTTSYQSYHHHHYHYHSSNTPTTIHSPLTMATHLPQAGSTLQA
ncbi:hypothetical protein Pmani_039210 [Petrolisthes manimaculis]|uniref:Uncharacterized protein n=1 Tax=Petrolisthes manimaculis TaxID=1843537 RepID=A0AAE1NE74_9EUCA|nr:hypothetical protein Pmani_039210 [Petrolisthes manimaculis]